ncbi:GNAT family N-acetyltransferase [Gordonia sp. NPDC003424]
MEVWTERLRLRQPDESDVDAICRACQDPDIQRFTRVPVPYHRSDAENFVRANAGVRSTVWTIRTRADHVFVGVIGVIATDDPLIGELGYWCAPEARGRGYLSESVQAVVTHCFDVLGLDRVTWSALVDNVASARLAAAAGFRYTGRGAEPMRGAGGVEEDVHTAVIGRTDNRARKIWPGHVCGPR